MSAYLLEPESIGKISHIVLDHVRFDKSNLRLDHKHLSGILAMQNVRSIRARYGNKSMGYDELVKDWISSIKTLKEYIELTDVPYTDAPAAINARRALLDEYRYQSCETDDWENTLSCAVTKLAMENLDLRWETWKNPGQDDKVIFRV